MKRRAAIAGLGQTAFSKDIGLPERTIALQAIAAALDDAGLTPADVDGLVRFDLESTTEVEIARNLGIPSLRFFAALPYGGGAGCATVALAAMAIATGQASVVVCWRARNRSSGGRPWAGTGAGVPGDKQFTAPYGLVRPVDQIAMLARRHMHEYGTTSAHFGMAAVACRKHAARNPAAMMREPITLADHQASRLVSDPLRKLDCCLETDGALAVVVTSVERARDLRQRPAVVLAAAQASGERHFVMTDYYGRHFLETPTTFVARDLFARAGVAPGDIDVAQIYDAFTPLVLFTLEELGFCAAGESGPLVSTGILEWPDGDLPTNTSGGGLSEAYVHGFNLILEGARQIRGTSTCQVEGAALSLVTSGAGVPTSALILCRD
ncbi:MAG: lipid-transfer protein [Deltaproteobacteria bacterium]|nr:lipid-transfer protein [Deltaproteobacteria bacterium]